MNTMIMVLSKGKRELRQKLLQRLLALTQDQIKRRSQDVQEQLSNLPLYKKAKTIMAYYPLPGEVDILGLIRKASKEKQFCFPVVDIKERALRVFRASRLEEDFIRGPYGIMEPDTKKTEPVDIKGIDLVIVPALAFDRSKNRLGRGGGFYDRFLRSLSASAHKVGLAFDFQILESLPFDSRLDVKVDAIASEHFTL